MQRALIYCRVDGPETESTREALCNQRARLIDYAQKKGMEIAGVYMDTGFPGTTMERPGLQAVVREAEAGKAEALLVVNRGRLFRGPWPDELRRLPVKIHAVNERSLER